THGNHILKVRAVDVNGRIGKEILKIEFDIRIPFWETLWFWLLTGILVQIILFYIIHRHLKKRREEKLARKIASVQTAAIEQQAFTSLMNPHFMFNALNSIQHYINLQDRKNANRYLSDFASLIRRNFEAAQESFVPLEEEIENIKIYLNLELMRFDDRFQFTLTIDEDLDVEDWMVPTMVLQPLLENALLHGIMPSAQPGEISIRFREQEKDLLIQITDNGIGVANSKVLKGFDAHKSRGTELIYKRIKALSHFGDKPIAIIMEPAFDNETHPGNQVSLLIPHSLYDSWRAARP
ncbi:MAG: histidine kinase, partial [Moheibacter sp.]